MKIVLPNRRKQPLLYQYQNQCRPQPAYIEIDPPLYAASKKITADYSGEIGNSEPSAVWHGLVFRIPISPEVSRTGLKELETDIKFKVLIGELVRSWEAVWNGNNWVGRFDAGTYDMLCRYSWGFSMDSWE